MKIKEFFKKVLNLFKRSKKEKYCNDIICPICGHHGMIISNNEMASAVYGLPPIFVEIKDEDYLVRMNKKIFKKFLDQNMAMVLDENTTIKDINDKVINEDFDGSIFYISKVIDGVTHYYECADVIVDFYTCPECNADMEVHPSLDAMIDYE